MFYIFSRKDSVMVISGKVGGDQPKGLNVGIRLQTFEVYLVWNIVCVKYDICMRGIKEFCVQ